MEVLREYGVEGIIDGVPLIDASSGNFYTGALASGDVQVSTDGGAFANAGTLPSETPASGYAYRVTISIAEMTGKRIVVRFQDQTSPKAFDDQMIIVSSYGNASAQHVNIPQTGDNFVALATAQTDLDTLTGTDGATLATSQPNYAPNTTTPPTAAAVADAVWDEPKADHTGATTFGDLATDLDTAIVNIAALNDVSVADILTTQMTEAYAADGVPPTIAQALHLIQQHLTEFAISGTTYTTKKLDGATTAATFTLDDASNPTSSTRAT